MMEGRPKTRQYRWPSRSRLQNRFESRTGLKLGEPPVSDGRRFAPLPWYQRPTTSRIRLPVSDGRRFASLPPWPGCSEELAEVLRDPRVRDNILIAGFSRTYELAANAVRAEALEHLQRVPKWVERALTGPIAEVFVNYSAIGRSILAELTAQRLGMLFARAGRPSLAGGASEEHPSDPLGSAEAQLSVMLLHCLRETLRPLQGARLNPPGGSVLEGAEARRVLADVLSQVPNRRFGRPLSPVEITLLMLLIGVRPWADTLRLCTDTIRPSKKTRI